jgi:4a-hydroxytetrahydrobiopterin dehydratase
MNFDIEPPALTRKKAVTCVLMNLLATPGLGSVMARRWFDGIGQLILSLVGFVLIMVWFFKLVIVQFYGQINGNVTVQPVGWIGLTGAILFAIAWFWSLLTSFSISQAAAKVPVASLQYFAAGLIKLDEPKIISALATLPDWRRNAEIISRMFQFKDFPAALKFVDAVGQVAEQVQHHPDIDIRWNKVTLAFTTHDAGGLTEKDFAMARQCDALSLR